jgi:hypothetical protein
VAYSELETETQVGLALPDGTIIWSPDFYRQYPLFTNNERAKLVNALEKLAEEISFPEGELLSHYTWLTRQRYFVSVYSDPTVHDIMDPNLITPTTEEDSEVRNQAGEGLVPNSEVFPSASFDSQTA